MIEKNRKKIRSAKIKIIIFNAFAQQNLLRKKDEHFVIEKKNQNFSIYP